MPNGIEPPKLPKFPTLFTEADAERLRILEEQRREIESIFQAKFTPEAWRKVPLPEKAVREFLPSWIAPVAEAVTPGELGFDFGFTPEQAQVRRLEIETEYKELVRKRRVSRLLNPVKETLRALALTEGVISDTGELTSVFKLGEMGFSEEDISYITGFAQRLLHASPEEIASGEIFELEPLTPQDVEELARSAIEPRQVLTTVALSRNLEDITAALQEMYAPQVEPTQRQKIIDDYIESLKVAGITKESSAKLFKDIAEEMGEPLVLTDAATGTMVPARKKSDNSVWVEDELVGHFNEQTNRLDPIGIQGQPLITPELQESAAKDLWDAWYLGANQAGHMFQRALTDTIPRALLELSLKVTTRNIPTPVIRYESERVEKARKQQVQLMQDSLGRKGEESQAQFDEWLKANPELAPKPEYLQDPFENTELFRDPGWYAYTMVSNAPIIATALGAGVITTVATGNPLIGAVAAAALITPIEIQSVQDDLMANGADPDSAVVLSTLVGTAIGAVEIFPGFIVLKIMSPTFMRAFRRNFQKEVTKRVTQVLVAKGALGVVKKIATDALKIIGIESLEEVVQQAMQNTAVKTVNENRSIVENLPQTFIQTVIATLPLGLAGAGASYSNIRANMSPSTKEEIDTTAKKMKDAGLSPDHAESVAISEVVETETGQAEIELAVDKTDAQTPVEPSERVLKLQDKISTINDDIATFTASIVVQEARLKKMEEARELPGDKLHQHGVIIDLKEGIEDLERSKAIIEKELRKAKKAEVPAAPEVTLGKIELLDKKLVEQGIAPELASRVARLLEPAPSAITPELAAEIQAMRRAAAVEEPVSEDLVNQIKAVYTPEKADAARKALNDIISGMQKQVVVRERKVAQEKRALEAAGFPTEGFDLPIGKLATKEQFSKAVQEANIFFSALNRVEAELGRLLPPSEEDIVLPPAVEEPVPEPIDPRLRIGLPLPGQEEGLGFQTYDRRPRIQDWEDEQAGVIQALKDSPNIAKAIKLDKATLENMASAKRTIDSLKVEQRDLLGKKGEEGVEEELKEVETKLKDIGKEARIGRKTLLAKGWDDLTPPEQRSLGLTAIPDRSIHFPVSNELFDIRYYMQFLQEKTGLPFHDIFKRAEVSHGAARRVAERFLERIGTDPHFSQLRTDEAGLARVAQEINSRNPTLGIESPEDLKTEELMLANVIESMYKEYQDKVRYLRVMRTTGTLEALKEEFPDAPETDLAVVAELRTMGNLDDLYDFLKDLEWGVIGSGYDPWMVSNPDLTSRRIRIGTTRGAARLMRRESVDYPELKMERNVLLRLSTYIKQMEAQWRIEPELDALEGLWSQAGVKFSNLGQVESALREWTRELQGIPTRQSFLDSVIRRVWRQAMGTIFQHLWMPFRNIHQHVTFAYDRTELLRLKEIPADNREKAGVFFDSLVSQLKGIRRDWLYTGEKGIPIPGFDTLLRASDRVSLYAHSDNIPRRATFLAGMNKARRATEQFKKDGNVTKWLKDSGANHLRQTERNYALQLLAVPTHDLGIPGLRELSGAEMATFFIGHELANSTHFVYERSFRGVVEFGPTGRTLYNLIVFPRGYFQRIYFQGQKVFGKDTSWEQARAGFKDIILLFVVGELMSRWLQVVTGRRRRSYAPLQIIQWELGGLAVGAFLDVQATINDIWTLLDWGAEDEDKKAALGRLPGDLQRGTRVQVPFYRHLVDSLDAIFDTDNIDAFYVRKLREILDESYTPDELEEIDRSTWEKMRLAILGGDVVDPNEFQKIQADLMEDYNRLGEMDAQGRFYTLRQLAGSIRSKTKELPDDMLTEEYGFPELIVFYKEGEDRWGELFKLPSTAGVRNEWRTNHIEEEAMLLFWGMYDKSVFRQGTPEWEQVSSLLRTWFSYYGIERREHKHWADWTTGGLTNQ